MYLYMYFDEDYCTPWTIFWMWCENDFLFLILSHRHRHRGTPKAACRQYIFNISCPFDPKSSHLKQIFTPNRQICNEHCFFCKPQWHTVERCLTIFLLLCNHKICAEIWWHTKNCFIQFSQVDLLTMKMLQKERKINPPHANTKNLPPMNKTSNK